MQLHTVTISDHHCRAFSQVMPRSAELWALPVKFEHLWKIRSPLHAVEGFDMKHFDDIIMWACDAADDNVEPQGGNSVENYFGLKNGLRFRFDSETCLNYPFLNVFLVLEGI